MRVYSDLANKMMLNNLSFSGYFQVIMLTRMPSVVPSSAPPGVAALLADLGYQELADSHYIIPSERPVVQTSGSGGPAAGSSVRLDGSAGTWIDGPDLAALAGAATLTLEIDCSLVDWTPTSSCALVSQDNGTASASAFQFRTTSTWFEQRVSNGASNVVYASAAANAFTDGTRHVVGGLWTAAASNMQFKNDGANFGSAIAGAAFPSGLLNSALGIRIGAVGDTTGRMNGSVYAVRIYAGGTLIASPDFTKMVVGQTSVTDAQGNVWTLQGAAAVVNPVTSVVSNVLTGSAIALPSDVPPTYLTGVALAWHGTTAGGANPTLQGFTNPWLMITDESFGQIVYPGSSLDTVSQAPRILWSWTTRGNDVDVTSTGLLRSPGIVPWEPPRTEHVFLFPQRINFVPDPSFEDVGLFGWRAKSALTRVVGGVDNANNYYGHVVGTRLESLPVPLTSDYVCISAYVRSAGATYVQLGLCNWSVDWDQVRDILSPNLPVVSTWTRLSYVTRVPDNVGGCGMLVVSDGNFDIDLVMVDSSADLKDYFDGDSTTGVLGDFSWQGITNQTLSFWYNNRYLVGARLFGLYVTGQAQKNGMVYDWIPAGTALATHWDVLSANDTKQPLEDFSSRVIP